MPDEEGFRTTILVNDSNRTTAIMYFGHAEKYIDRMETLIDSGIVVHFLRGNGDVNATLKADSARLDDKSGDMCAFGSVSVYSPGNKTLVLTEEICYTKESKRLHSDTHVAVHDTLKKRFVEGVGYESDEALKSYTIYRPSGRAESLE